MLLYDLMIVAIQGTAGSFHEQAAREMFAGYDFETQDCRTFRDVFAAVQSGAAEYGVVAIENSLHGPINPVYKLLADEGLQICGETRLQIALYLIGYEAFGLDMLNVPITKVFSQREALSQCETWLANNLENAEIVEASDTAESVKMVMEQHTTEKLAIASRQAARVYNAEVIAGPINDDPENYTRFVAITKKDPTKDQVIPDANRTSIILTEDSDQAGKLYDALGVFAKANINLSKLHSHPRPGKKRIYSFYIDFDASLARATELGLLESIRLQGWKVQILGSYKAEDEPH